MENNWIQKSVFDTNTTEKCCESMAEWNVGRKEKKKNQMISSKSSHFPLFLHLFIFFNLLLFLV